MKITAEFNSNEELLNFISTFGAKGISPKVEELVKPIQAPIVEKSIQAPKEDKKEEPAKDIETKEETITKEQIRAAFAKLVKAGKQKEAKEITSKYGASKVTEIKEEDYEAILKEVEELI